MALNQERVFEFASRALGPNDLEVVSFTGQEVLSELFFFDVVLASKKDDIDPEQVIGAPAVLTLRGAAGSFPRHGLAATFEQTGKADDYAFYRARLAPKAFLASLNENSRIFLDKSLDLFLAQTLQDEGLAQGTDFEFRLSRSYPQRPQVSQFRETSLAFVWRWLERDGLYVFFEHGPTGVKMVITDNRSVHKPLQGKSEFRYETPSGMVAGEGDDEGLVHDFLRRARPAPRSVLVKDWNYETPSADLEAEAPAAADGRGVSRFYGDHFRTVEEGRDMARIRAQEILAGRDVRHGKGFFPGMAPGWLFSLTNHFQREMNREYLATAVRHQGRQFGFLTSGLGLSHEPDGQPETFYRNEFSAIPSDVQFRPERKTPWPRLEGLMNAVIDGPGSGKYAQVDDQGRYKIILAYDRSGRRDGKASKWVRMAQPYGGTDHGLHFPLHKGCEVLVAFVDGDPDRPVIVGAGPNPENKSVVARDNQTRSVLRTAGSNEMYFEDKEGSERILWQSAANQTFMRLGAPNDPFSDHFESPSEEGQSGIAVKTPGFMTVLCGSYLSTYMIGYIDTILILLNELYAVTQLAVNAGFVQNLYGYKFHVTGSETEVGAVANRLNASEHQIAANKTHLIDELIAARTRITDATAELNDLRDELTRLEGRVDALHQSVTRLAQQETVLAGQVDVLAQQKTDLAESNTRLAGTLTDMAQSKIDAHERLVEAQGQLTEALGTATDLAEERTNLFGQVTTTSTEIMQMSDLDLTL